METVVCKTCGIEIPQENMVDHLNFENREAEFARQKKIEAKKKPCRFCGELNKHARGCEMSKHKGKRPKKKSL